MYTKEDAESDGRANYLYDHPEECKIECRIESIKELVNNIGIVLFGSNGMTSIKDKEEITNMIENYIQSCLTSLESEIAQIRADAQKQISGAREANKTIARKMFEELITYGSETYYFLLSEKSKNIKKQEIAKKYGYEVTE
jgi:hypothetical protein